MKKYIIISAMLVCSLGLSAQNTNQGTRNARTATETRKDSDEEKKSVKSDTQKPAREANSEQNVTRNREAAPARTSTQERRDEPVYNESRNREIPQARPSQVTRSDNRSEGNRTATGSSDRGTSGRSEEEYNRTSHNNNTSTSNSVNERESYQRSETRHAGNYEPGDRNEQNQIRRSETERNREYVPKSDEVYTRERKAYRTPERTRTARTVNSPAGFVHHPIEYRRTYYPYAEPRHIDIIWDMHMYNEYCYMYPYFDYWYYPFGYRIHTISAYDADRYIGEVARVYGRVSDVWYERQTDEYFLYFGEPYPFQDFCVIIPGRTARRFSYHPERYFIERNIAVTGLVSLWNERPEMQIRKRSQIEVYF